jgi:hypothetical protein
MTTKIRILWVLAVVLFTSLACTLLGTSPTPAPTAESPTETVQLAPPTTAPPVDTATQTTAPAEPTQADTPVPPTAAPTASYTEPEEVIWIQAPGPGSRVVSPVRITGMADPTFEQNLVVRILLDDGTQIALEPTTIQSELSERGPFELDLAFIVSIERQAFIQVYSVSARDGGITHLSSVGVILAPSGPPDIRANPLHAERIIIADSVRAQPIRGGVLHVEGIALASFEQTLVVELQDEEGNILAMQPVIVQAPDLGIPGPFSVDLTYQVSEAMPGRIVVRDPSPAFEGDYHIASLEVDIEP